MNKTNVSITARLFGKPLLSIVICAQKATAFDVLESRNLRQGPLELLLGQVEGVVVDRLSLSLKGVEKEANFAEVSAVKVNS